MQQQGVFSGDGVLRAPVGATCQALLLPREVQNAPRLFARELFAATPQLVGLVLLERVPDSRARAKPRVNVQLAALFKGVAHDAVHDKRVEGERLSRFRLCGRGSRAAAGEQALLRERHRFVVGALDIEHPAQHEAKRVLEFASPPVLARGCRCKQPLHGVRARRR